MHSVIYYFSGSGNSLAVARDLAKNLDADLIPAAATQSLPSITTEAEAVGFVFPLYDFKHPSIMEELVAKLKNLDAKYLFAVCTYGIAPSSSLHRFDKLLRAHGGHLAAGFAVEMPHNAIGSITIKAAEDQKVFENWNSKRTEVCNYLSERRQGRIESSNGLLSALQPRFLKMLPSLMRFLIHIARHGVQSLQFTTNQSCVGCGSCTKVCPLNNIQLVDQRPVWSNHCLSCFACMQWCPKQAISLGGAKLGIRSYHHPDLTVADMFLR